MKRKILWIFVVLLAVGYLRVPAFGQSSNTGSLRGTVVDPSGAVIRSATVVLANGDGYSHTETSQAYGNFEFQQLMPGQLYAFDFSPWIFFANIISGG